MKKFQFTVREIAEIAMLVALAVLLDRDGLKIRLGSQSGSLSLTMVPLIVIALRHGLLKGFLAIGVVYGLITNLLDGYGFATYPFDYLLAYGSLSLIALGKPLLEKTYKQPWVNYVLLAAAIVAVAAIRLVFHTISGMLLYEVDLIGSLAYNAIFVVIPPTAAAIPVMLLLWRPLQSINKRYPIGVRDQ